VRERERSYKRGSREQGKSLMNLHNNEAGRRVKFALLLDRAQEMFALLNVASLKVRARAHIDFSRLKFAERSRSESDASIIPFSAGYHQKVQGDV